MAGYECADHINRDGERINLLQETQHDVRVLEDYALLHGMGIGVVREGICWSAVERADGSFNFDEVLARIKAAQIFGIQQIWDLIHFGYPDGLYPTHPLFCRRFIDLCTAFAQFYTSHTTQQLFVVPINEISFLSWHSGDVRGTVPFAINSGWDIKYHLCKAAILGIRALKEADPGCRIVLVEPLIYRHHENSDIQNNDTNEFQFQAMDIIAGRICPELGGDESFLDILGFNYYWNCQWYGNNQTLPWPEEEGKQRIPFSELLKSAYGRYQKPLFVSETGHFGIGRAQWIEEITAECILALNDGVPIEGICIYPVTDRPDWDNLNNYFHCGVWDLDHRKNRIPHNGYIYAITECMAKITAYFTKTYSKFTIKF